MSSAQFDFTMGGNLASELCDLSGLLKEGPINNADFEDLKHSVLMRFKNGASPFISMTESTLAAPSNACKDVPRPEPLQVRLPSATSMLATFPCFCKHQLEHRFFKIQGCYSEFSELYAPLFGSRQNNLQGNSKSVFFQELSKARK